MIDGKGISFFEFLAHTQLRVVCARVRAAAMAESSSSSSTRQYTGDETKKTVLGDGITMKRMIDDAVRRRLHLALLRPRSTPACPRQIIGVLLEDDSDFVEDVALSNFKLVVGFASVGASVVSHVYPAAFPKNWRAGVCVHRRRASTPKPTLVPPGARAGTCCCFAVSGTSSGRGSCSRTFSSPAAQLQGAGV